MARPAPFSAGFCRLQRLALRANLLVILLLAGVIFGMVNYLSMRHYARAHWNRGLFVELSGKSLHLLDSVEADIRVVAVMRPSNVAYPSVIELLKEYEARSSTVSVEFVDPDRNMGRTEQIARQYRLTASECVVFEIGGRHQAVSATDLIENMDPSAPGAPPLRAFRGEQLFSSAIYSLTQSSRPTIHFVQGHGERSPLDFDRRSGYSRIAARLRDENLDVELLHLGEAKTVPNHCALMVIAGPMHPFAPFEIALIRDYLDRKGRLLLLLDARTRTGLEPLLLEWGAILGDDIVNDESLTLGGRELYISTYPDHPITAPLQGLASVLFLPRSIRPRPFTVGGDKPSVSALVTCSALGWAEFDPDDASAHFDPQVDISGPVPVAVAIERGPVSGVQMHIRPTRLVIFGDSDFASNSGIMGANADLFLNSVNWLLDREELLALSPKTFEELQLVMNARQLRTLFWAVVVAMPGIVAALGVWVAWRRRR